MDAKLSSATIQFMWLAIIGHPSIEVSLVFSQKYHDLYVNVRSNSPIVQDVITQIDKQFLIFLLALMQIALNSPTRLVSLPLYLELEHTHYS